MHLTPALALALAAALVRALLPRRRRWIAGNEQYNPDFIAQVSAMEARAAEIGGVPPLRYMFPDNAGLNSADQAAAIAAKLPIERIMPDVHVGAGGAVEAAATLFSTAPDFPMSAINCETNAGSHDLRRGLDEAADLIDWFTSDTRTTDRLYARTASFCSGSSSQFDSWDQGISFFLPNMTWLQVQMTHNLFCFVAWGVNFSSDRTLSSDRCALPDLGGASPFVAHVWVACDANPAASFVARLLRFGSQAPRPCPQDHHGLMGIDGAGDLVPD